MDTVHTAIRDIERLYGLRSPTGERLLLAVVQEMGVWALSEAAVMALAAEHRAEERRTIATAVRK